VYKFLTQNQWKPLNLSQKKINTTLSRSNTDENLIQLYRTGMEESWRRKWKVVRKWNVIVWKGILFLFSICFSTMLTACVFITRDTVHHLRRFVFGKFVRKPNFSWSEAFVNRGLTVYTCCKWCLMSKVPWVYIPEDGPQWPKHVVSLINRIQIQLCFGIPPPS